MVLAKIGIKVPALFIDRGKRRGANLGARPQPDARPLRSRARTDARRRHLQCAVAAASTVAAASARAAPPKAVKLKKRPRAGSDDDEWAPPAGAAGGLERATEAYIARAVADAAGVNVRGRPKRQAAIEAVAKADLCQWQDESLSDSAAQCLSAVATAFILCLVED